jgi:hypothetical protein
MEDSDSAFRPPNHSGIEPTKAEPTKDDPTKAPTKDEPNNSPTAQPSSEANPQPKRLDADIASDTFSPSSGEAHSAELPVSPLESVLRRPGLFAVVTVLGLIVAAIFTLGQPKVYYAQTTLTVASAGVNGESVPLDNAGAASTAFAFSRYGFSTASANGITKRTRLTTSQAFPALRFDAAPNSPFITIRASGPTPGSAFRLADAASESLKEIVAKFRISAEQRLKDQQSGYEAARSNTLTIEAEQLELQTRLSALQNDLLFDPKSTAIQTEIDAVRTQLRATTLSAESNRAKAEAQLASLSDAATQIENGLQLRTFTETFLAGSDGGLKPGPTGLIIVLAGLLAGLALATMLENRAQVRAIR